MKTLPPHYARCEGVFFHGLRKIHYREDCEKCLRRIAPHPQCDIWMAPPVAIVFQCEYFIYDDRDMNNKPNL